MIYFDLDQVIRDTHSVVMGYPAEQQHVWNAYKDGVHYCDIIKRNLNLLYEAPPTKYYQVIKELNRVNILTCQPEKWRHFTLAWIYEHFDFDQVSCVFVDLPIQKFEHLGPGDILVEDFPNFHNYSQIALIEYPYNKHVTGEFARIRTVDDLERLLNA